MVNINGSSIVYNETDEIERCDNFTNEFNDLIWSMKAIDYINDDSQNTLSRVHVLCCTKCDFLTISLKVLHQHMTVSHSVIDDDFNNLVIYSCQECKCVSTEQKLIQEHIKIFHHISTEHSSTSSKSEPVVKESAILVSSSATKHRHQLGHIRLLKTQLKIRKKISQRKSMKVKLTNFLNSDIPVEHDNNNNNCLKTIREIKRATEPSNDRMVRNQTVNENDPLDMSINSTTCPFKSINGDPIDYNNHSYPMKQEPILNEPHNSMNNTNPLLSNPQTCIELIKLTLNQMLNKTNEQNRLSHIGFNPSSFLQSQFQIPSNIVPLILPTAPQNDLSFATNNPEIEAILTNIQQQNLLKSLSPKSFEPNNHMIAYQQSPLYLNHNIVCSTSSATNSLHVDNNQKSGILSVSPLCAYSQKKACDFQHKTVNKRSLKKQSLPSKIPNGISDELGYSKSPKFENNKPENSINENLFNRSFLDSTEIDVSNDQLDLTKVLDAHTNFSNKSSPNTLSNDKPHRQNFTSQQNRILTDWFFTHCDKPYPSTEDTKELSQLSGLTYSQVKKWFANKRARSSLNKKSHKSYSLTNPGDLTMEEMTNNDELSVSPSSGSDKSYTHQIEAPEAIDFSTYNQEDVAPE